MSPAKFHEYDDDFDHHHQSSIRNMREINGPRPSPLKINKDSHAIQKSSSSILPLAQNKQQKQPVIIYAHSPKVIHTHPKDFMALVQKLTGLSAADHESTATTTTTQAMKKLKQKTNRDDHDHHINDSSNSEAPTNPFLADMPLFTPTDHNFFNCSPTPMFSPSFIQFMKGLPEC